MAKYSLKKGEYGSIPTNSDNEFFGNGWSVIHEDDKFYLKYVSGSLQGELKKIEITQNDFNLAKENKITLDEFCIKYNIF